MGGEQFGDEADAAHTGVAVLFGEAQAGGQEPAHVVAVEDLDLPAHCAQAVGHGCGDGGLAGAGQAGQPHRDAFGRGGGRAAPHRGHHPDRRADRARAQGLRAGPYRRCGLVAGIGLEEVDHGKPNLLAELALLGGQTPTPRVPHICGVPQRSRLVSARHHAFVVSSFVMILKRSSGPLSRAYVRRHATGLDQK
jgi:hypothetical protein